MADSDWQILGRFRLENNWVLLPTINSEIFRVTHNISTANIERQYLKARIATGIKKNGRFNPYKPQLLTYDKEPRMIPLEGFPKELGNPFLGAQRLDDSPILWDVLIEAFPSVNAQDNLVDRIVKQLMYFNLTNQNGSNDCGDNTQLIPKQTNIPCEKGVPVLIAAGDNKRRSLTIKNYGNKPLILGRSVEVDPEEGTVTDVKQRFESIPPGKGFPFPVDEGCIYKGDVFALPRFNGEIEVIEWTKEMIPEQEPEGE